MKRILLALLAVLSMQTTATADDIKQWVNDVDLKFIEGIDADHCQMEYEFIINHAINNDGFRKEEGGATLKLNGKKILKVYHTNEEDGMLDVRYEYLEGVLEYEKEGWRFDFVPLSDVFAKWKYADNKCKEADHNYSKLIMTLPAEALNQTYTVEISGDWWRWGWGWSDDTKIAYPKSVVAKYPIKLGKFLFDNVTLDRNKNLIASMKTDSVPNCPNWLQYVVSATGHQTVTTNFCVGNYDLGPATVVKYNDQGVTINAEVNSNRAKESYNKTSLTENFSYYGYPYPDSLDYEFDKEEHTLKLKWKIKGKTNLSYVENGVWQIYRKDESSPYSTEIPVTINNKGVPLDSVYFEDKNFEYNKKYTYYICYHNNDWNYSTLDELKIGLAGVETTLDPNLQLNTTSLDDRVTVDIKFEPTKTDGFYSVYVYRDDDYHLMKHFDNIAKGVGSLVYEDIYDAKNNLLNRHEPHSYIVKIRQNKYNNTVIAESSSKAAINSYTKISDWQASQGTYPGEVRVQWHATRSYTDVIADNYIIERREVGMDSQGYSRLKTLSTTDSNISYSDKTALPGIDYMYRISMMSDENDSIVTQKEVQGYLLSKGTIAGRITYPNGTALKGAKVTIQARSNTETSSNVQLKYGDSKYEAITDDKGNFIVRDVEYKGEGTTYAVIPEYGTHKFSPAQSLCYLSQTSIVHNEMDFLDVSAFTVKGRIAYKYGDFPVEGVTIKVDGEPAMFNGEEVKTNSQGEYWVEVSPGKHYIEVAQDNHKFAYDGRFPNEEGAYYTFYQDVSEVDFIDETLMTIRGRVSGGMQQAALPLTAGYGGGSRANIGQATLLLAPVSNMAYVVNTSESKTIRMPDADVNVKSHTYLLPYNREAGVGQAQILIKTDSLSGEFCAQLPPLHYQVLTGSTASVSADSLRAYDVSQINPVLYYRKDVGLIPEQEKDTMCYYAGVVVPFLAPPILEMKDAKHKDGAFGLESVELGDEKFEMYDIAADGSINYKLKYPVFQQGTTERITLYGYQKYINADNTKPQETLVPLANTDVCFSDYSWSDNTKASENTVTLDEEGKGYFRFKVGAPLRESEMHERPLHATITYGNRTYSYPDEPLRAIVLGFDMSTAKGFITTGPDKVCLVLRDPPGSESFATLEEGSSFTNKWAVSNAETETDGSYFHISLGSGGTWEKWGSEQRSFGTWESCNIKFKGGASGNFFVDWSKSEKEVFTDKYSSYATYTFNKSISTGSDANNVGSRGDVFIGSTTLKYIGSGYRYDIVRNLPAKLLEDTYYEITNKSGQKAYLCAHESYSVGVYEDKGKFAFTRHYITDELLPTIERVRNSEILEKGTEVDWNALPDSVECVYVSLVDADDEYFGKNGRYEQVVRQGVTSALDVIQEYNNYYQAWVDQLAANEMYEAGVNYDKTLTFGSGSTYTESKTYTYEHTTTETATTNSTHLWDNGFELDVNLVILLNLKAGRTESENHDYQEVTDETETNTIKTSFTLKDTDLFDNHLVAIHSADPSVVAYEDGEITKFDGYAFRLLGGNSTRPWEKPEYSEYFSPGQEVISYGTVPVQQPQMWLEETEITDVPSGSAALLTVHLQNISEVESNQGFVIDVAEGTNDKGLEMMMDGMALGGDPRTIYINAGESVTKTIRLTQTNTDELDYENIQLRLHGTNVLVWEMNNPTLVDRKTFSVHFKPSSSPSTLVARDANNLKTSTVNISTGDSIKLEATDYDLRYKGFYKLAMQRKGAADVEWHTIHEWALNDSIAEANNIQDVIGKNSTISYVYDMHDLADQTYDFRILTYAKYGHEDMTRESNVLTIVKDMEAPRLLGAASPKGGVLTADGEVSLQFNEEIYSSRIVNANISVRGELNRQETSNQTGLKFDYNEGVTSQGQVKLTSPGIAVEMWVKNDSTGRESTIFQHTSEPDGFKVGFNKDKHLWMTAGGQEFTSKEPINSDGWQYMCVGFSEEGFYHYNWYSYIDENGRLQETVMEDTEATAVPIVYDKRGRVTVGSDFSGAVSNLILWDKARSHTEALTDRDSRPSGRETGLMGYWPMNECHGDVASDVVRNHNLKLKDVDHWYSALDNISAEFNGTDSLVYLGGAAPILDSQDFCLEMWIRTSGKDGQLFATDNKNEKDGSHLSIALEDGKPVMNALGMKYVLSNEALNNDRWHHLALNMMRNGSLKAYVDGKDVRTLPVSVLGGVYDDKFIVGKGYKGRIDELRLWTASLTSDAIKYNMYNRVDADDAGLLFYLPMEKSEKYEGTGVWHTVADFRDFSTTQVQLLSAENEAKSVNDGPTLAPKKLTTTVGFNWVASKDKLVINLTEQLYRIEGTTLQFCVDRIADRNGNEIAAPIYWTAFIDKNRLVWKGDTDQEKNVHVFDDCEFEAVIANNGDAPELWSLSNIPSWLTVSEEQGTLDPLKEKKITFALTEGTPIGTYEAVISLLGNDVIHEPMHITVNVTGDTPDWKVTPEKYLLSASIVTELNIDGYIDEDENDLVGAFLDDECVGVGHLKYYELMDRYLVIMNIYGNGEYDRKEVKFRIWDASTGLIYPEVMVKDYEGKDTLALFADYRIWGTPNEPFTLKATDVIEQHMKLNKGWTWVSMFVDPGEDHRKIGDIFVPGNYVKNMSGYAQFSQETQTWGGKLADGDLDLLSMYMVKNDAADALNISGRQLNDKGMEIKLENGWNWIGYTPFESMTLEAALSDLTPEVGDIIKSQTNFAQYTKSGWIGNLNVMVPGEGYVYWNTSGVAKSFTYPERYSATYKVVRSAKRDDVDPALAVYPRTMNMAVSVVRNGAPVCDGVLMALNGGECRENRKAEANDLYWMSVHGEGGKEHFHMVYYDEKAGLYYLSKETMMYEADTMIGTAEEPVVFNLAEAIVCNSLDEVVTGISVVTLDENDTSELYDIQGRRIQHVNTHGVYIKDRQKIIK